MLKPLKLSRFLNGSGLAAAGEYEEYYDQETIPWAIKPEKILYIKFK
jgi:hypothetical protein